MTTQPDVLLAILRSGLDEAPKIFDLGVRLRWYGVLVTKASCALAIDFLTTEQRDALVALNELAKAGRDATALALPPTLSTLEAV